MATRTTIKPELLDELLEGRDPKTVFESEGLLDELKKALAERMLNAEMDHHLGQESEQGLGNHRNGTNPKTVLTDTGSCPCRCRGIDRGASRRRSLPSTSGASPGSMRRSSRCTPAA